MRLVDFSAEFCARSFILKSFSNPRVHVCFAFFAAVFTHVTHAAHLAVAYARLVLARLQELAQILREDDEFSFPLSLTDAVGFQPPGVDRVVYDLAPIGNSSIGRGIDQPEGFANVVHAERAFFRSR